MGSSAPCCHKKYTCYETLYYSGYGLWCLFGRSSSDQFCDLLGWFCMSEPWLKKKALVGNLVIFSKWFGIEISMTVSATCLE